MRIHRRNDIVFVGKFFSPVANFTHFDYRPDVGGVVGFADLYVDQALGFSLGWASWVSLYTRRRVT